MPASTQYPALNLTVSCILVDCAVSGFGFGVISGAFSLVNVLADMTGPGTVGIMGQSTHFFITSGSGHVCLSVVVCSDADRQLMYMEELVQCFDVGDAESYSYTNNQKRLSVPCYFLAPSDKHKHTAHAHQQAASQASSDSTWRHPVWLPHSSPGFQRPVGRSSYRLMPQSRSAIVACYL